VSGAEDDWRLNYFNYFTEVEEHFQKARGTGLFLLSPLDWALVESWKNAGIPLEAVLRGIDAAFVKWRSRKSKFRQINSLAYCAQAVIEEAQAMAGLAQAQPARQAAAPFTPEEVRRHLEEGRKVLDEHPNRAYRVVAEALQRILAEIETHYRDLEQLEQRLTALEEKMAAIARAAQSEEELFEARRRLEAELRPWRSKMTAAQLALLEKQYLERRLLEAAGLPRLSLFYLR